MKRFRILLLLPLLLSCQRQSGYSPNPLLPSVFRDRTNEGKKLTEYRDLVSGSIANIADRAKAGETCLVFFWQEGCHACEDSKEGFLGWASETSAKVYQFNNTDTRLLDVISTFRSLYPDQTSFFSGIGTPFLFSIQGETLVKYDVYAHSSTASVFSSYISAQLSFPYIYEDFTAEEFASSTGLAYYQDGVEDDFFYEEVLPKAKASQKRLDYYYSPTGTVQYGIRKLVQDLGYTFSGSFLYCNGEITFTSDLDSAKAVVESYYGD